MNATFTKLAIVSAFLVQAAGVQAAFAATADSSNLFQLSEVPGMTSGASVQLAAKCGAGSCGGKEMKKDADHKCGKKDAAHKCAAAKCASKKDGAHHCASKTTTTTKTTEVKKAN